MSWLRNRILLFPRGLLLLAAIPIPRQFKLDPEQTTWVDNELDRLLDVEAIKLVGIGPERPACLMEVSPIFLCPKSGPKKWQLIINLRRLNKTLPDHTF